MKTIVVTGDHPLIAAAVAERAGLNGGQTHVGGAPLAKLADAELRRNLNDRTVVARATPADKLRIVRVLQRRGEIVAVTGDGVNDAPALASADLGSSVAERVASELFFRDHCRIQWTAKSRNRLSICGRFSGTEATRLKIASPSPRHGERSHSGSCSRRPNESLLLFPPRESPREWSLRSPWAIPSVSWPHSSPSADSRQP